MKSGFKNRTAIKNQEPKDHPVNGKNSPWDYRCPQYDERTSCFINAGTHYGTGVNQPIGMEGNPKQAYGVPTGRVNTMRVDEKG